MRPTIKIFGHKLAQARREHFLTQLELGGRVGMRERSLQRVERQEVSGIDLSRVPKFAAALRMTEQEFLKKLAVPDDHVAAPAGDKLVARLAEQLAGFAKMPAAERAAVAAELAPEAARAIVETLQSRIRGKRKKPAA